MDTPSKQNSVKSNLRTAVRILLDSDSTPDRDTTDIFLLGVTHEGFRDPTDESTEVDWPAEFFSDFRSRIWCTYRKDFVEIRDSTAKWTSDAGWGCMIRTDWRRPPSPPRPRSSLFLPSNTSPKSTHRRNASIPSSPPIPFSPTHAAYVRLLTWFLDTPEAPFCVHKLCFAGKNLGTQIGQWFGPSIAAGAIKTLVEAYPACGLGVSLAEDGVLYESSVFEASHSAQDLDSEEGPLAWGDRPVLLLLGLRLGLDGVNPIYFSTIKELFTFPQSAGIAGGRPSSSYYFVGAQGDGLFYLDPHHSRPAVPVRSPPPGTAEDSDLAKQYYATAYSTSELQTYHCEKVRKMPISGLDPSMLVGFLVRDLEEWRDFRRRVLELPRAIFSVQDTPPLWPTVDLGGDDDDEFLALESLPSSSSEDAHPSSSQVLTPRAVTSALALDTSSDVASSPVSSDMQSPVDIPSTPARINSEDFGGKGRLSSAMEGLRNKLRLFGRSRTSLPLGESQSSK
ncbi:hypothetical protein C8F01DRAFT_1178815 [Mycena amicta]|nr:hypothetical protein C8F01DRAFT_1178815 [Mycena amicta]